MSGGPAGAVPGRRLAWVLALVASAASASCAGDAPATAGGRAIAVSPWVEHPASRAPDALPDIVELTAERIMRDYAEGRYTANQLVRAYLARIARYERVYNAFVSLNPDALAAAAALDEEYRSSGPRGPLHGVPLVIKDNIDHAGLVTTAGYAGFSAVTGGVDMIPDHDAAVVSHLRAGGAIVLGKTNLPDFASDGTRTRSTVAGVTRNAWSLDRAPGGSSGGTATAVSASFGALGLGTETGGSIQNPAAAQGLVGVTPTFGLVPLAGVVPVDPTYRDVVGPITRTVWDAALVLDVIAGPTSEDPRTAGPAGRISEGGYAAALEGSALAGRRFGLIGPGWREQYLPLAPETERLYRLAISALRERGAEVVEDPFAGSEWRERYARRRSAPGVGDADLRAYLERLGPGAAFHSVEEWERLTGRSFRGAMGEPDARRRPPGDPGAHGAFGVWQREMRALFRRVLAEHELDGLFFPQAGGPVRPLVEDPDRPDYSPNNHPELPSNIVNDVGLPVVTLPVDYYADGMPFVVAFIGEPWSEAALLAFAYDLEQATRARRAPALATDTIR